MKFPARLAAAALLLFFAGFSPAQEQKSPPGAAPGVSSAVAPPESAQDKTIPPPAPGALFPTVVARVNGEPVYGRDLEALVRAELNSIGNPEWKNLRSEYRSEVALNSMTSLINSKLLYQKAAASGVKVTEAEVKAELQKVAATYKSEAAMNEALAREKTDRAAFEKILSQNLAMSKYVEETVNKKVVVTPEEVSKYYSGHTEEFQHPEIVRTSQILIQPAGNDPEQDAAAIKRAEALLARVQKGEDFAKLAQENSQDASASKGGDIGFISSEGMAQEYADAAFSLPVGGTTLVRTQYGYHVIKVTDKKKEGLFTLEEVRPQLHELLKAQKTQENLNTLINQLREKANIELLLSARELLN